MDDKQMLSTAIEKVIDSMQLSALKPKQLEAVSSFVAGNDTFISLPTGYDYIRG